MGSVIRRRAAIIEDYVVNGADRTERMIYRSAGEGYAVRTNKGPLLYAD
jgi:hypothetical protein